MWAGVGGNAVACSRHRYKIIYIEIDRKIVQDKFKMSKFAMLVRLEKLC